MLFKKFKDDPNTEGWIVLHSLDTAKHVRQIEGEADFVILVPEYGVLVLEVKAGDVKREGGTWIYKYGPDVEKTPRSPFKQASEAMHSVRSYIVGKNALLKDVLFFSAVAFTKIEFEEASPEWHEWQYVSKSAANRKPVSDWCMEILRRAHKHISTRPSAGWYEAAKAKPTAKQVDAMAKLLRPDFEYFQPPQDAVREVDEELKRYTENQFDALDSLEENPRTLFKGLAGTGKTLIALEAARRALMDGKRVLLICFNKLLGDWVVSKTTLLAKETDGHIRSGTLHSVLLEVAGCEVPDSADSEFWRNELPSVAIEKLLTASDDVHVYDQIIIDECQDFGEESYFDFIDLCLSGGLSAGEWVMFGDFDKQAVYGRELDIPELLRQRAPGHTVFRLTDNCRNVFPVAKAIEYLCSPDPSYKNILHRSGASEISVCFFSGADDQIKKLELELEKLVKVYSADEIVVLSSKADRHSCPGLLSGKTKIALRPIAKAKDGDSVRYGSIHSYKGLEAAAIVLTDIESISTDYEQSLLYVGMSRARQRLVLLLEQDCKDDYRTALRSSLGIGSH